MVMWSWSCHRLYPGAGLYPAPGSTRRREFDPGLRPGSVVQPGAGALTNKKRE